MNDMTPDRNERKANLKGLGSSRKRVEDLRFTQGLSLIHILTLPTTPVV